MRVALAFALLWSGLVFAQAPSPEAREEIAHLFKRLEQSGCQFERNGSWYQPRQAVGHLRKKYQHLLKRDLVPTAESFVELAASRSSMSGRPYLVRCTDQGEVKSKVWFVAELTRFRDAKRNAK